MAGSAARMAADAALAKGGHEEDSAAMPDNIFLPVEYVIGHLEYKLQRKSCIGYFSYAIFFVTFCVSTQSVPDAYTTFSAYDHARSWAGVAPLSDADIFDDANDWIAASPFAIAHSLPRFCPLCQVVHHCDMLGVVGNRRTDTVSSLGNTPADQILPRNVSTDFDQTARAIDSMVSTSSD